MAACRAGFWPWAAVRICPRITSDTSPGSTLARSRAAPMATAPRSCAGRLAKEPLNDPTGVLAPEAITTSIDNLFSLKGGIRKRKMLHCKIVSGHVRSDARVMRRSFSTGCEIPLERQKTQRAEPDHYQE